jgi:hypothetical protein
MTSIVPELRGTWDGPAWRSVPALSIDYFRPEGTDHKPRTQCKLLFNDSSIFGIFRVEDQFVRSLHTGFQAEVWKDSCVELFLQPNNCSGYFNFEFNCGGALLASYVTDSRRVNGRLQGYTPLLNDDDSQIERFASLPAKVEPEIAAPLTWLLEFAIPLVVLEKYTGLLQEIRGQSWRGNVYKCGNETSHPHWASWSPLATRNFHDPASFGRITFCG